MFLVLYCFNLHCWPSSSLRWFSSDTQRTTIEHNNLTLCNRSKELRSKRLTIGIQFCYLNNCPLCRKLLGLWIFESSHSLGESWAGSKSLRLHRQEGASTSVFLPILRVWATCIPCRTPTRLYRLPVALVFLWSRLYDIMGVNMCGTHTISSSTQNTQKAMGWAPLPVSTRCHRILVRTFLLPFYHPIAIHHCSLASRFPWHDI